MTIHRKPGLLHSLIFGVIYRFEAGGQGQHSIQKVPILKGVTFSRAEAVGWLESVAAALDCYNWVFKDQLFSPSELFEGKINHQYSNFDFDNELLNIEHLLCLLFSIHSFLLPLIIL